MERQPVPAWAAIVISAAALSACGGGSNNASIGGSISGLASGATVVIQNNGTDNLSLTANGAFEFPTRLQSSTAYVVTVLTQPSGQVCTVENGSGTTDTNADSVNTVNVTCITMVTVGGTVTGLNPGTAVTLSNGDVLLPVAVNGDFAFPGLLAAGAAYTITVATQPLGESCTVLNGTGTVTAGVPVNVTVSCSGA